MVQRNMWTRLPALPYGEHVKTYREAVADGDIPQKSAQQIRDELGLTTVPTYETGRTVGKILWALLFILAILAYFTPLGDIRMH